VEEFTLLKIIEKNKGKVIGFSLIVIIAASFLSYGNILAEETFVLPSWLKNTAKWWGEGTTTDTEFVNALQFLIDNDIIKDSKGPDLTGLPEVQIVLEKTTYSADEEIVITLKNIGKKIAYFSSTPPVPIIINPDGKSVCCVGSEGIGVLQPNQEETMKWHPKLFGDDNPPAPGVYKILISYWFDDEQNDSISRNFVITNREK